jgi:NAD(P)H-hydrate epimerase
MSAASPDPLPLLPPRAPNSHKGDFGRALLIGGSRGMAGAIALAGMATLRSGAGLVRLAVASDCLATLAAYEPSYMTAELPADRAGHISLRSLERIEELAASATVVACGPGLGRSGGLTHLVATLYERVERPLVLDADGLNALAQSGTLASQPRRLSAPRVLTPHPAEFARLISASTGDVQARREELAQRFAADHGIVLILKGHRSVITDGRRTAINATGNPGMATGGTGDVLTGIVTGLLCQGLSPYDAARLAAYVHGLAGDLAASELGQTSLIASDLLRFLPAAFQALSVGSALV